jgi:hypothetical protein
MSCVIVFINIGLIGADVGVEELFPDLEGIEETKFASGNWDLHQ